MLLRGRHDGEGECYHTSTTHSRKNLFLSFQKLSQHPQPYFPRQRRVDQLMVTKQQALLRGSSTSHWNVGVVGIHYPRGFGQKQSLTISLHISGTF